MNNCWEWDGWAGKNSRKTHCPQGHLLEGDNLIRYFLKHGKRICRTCKQNYDKRRVSV